MCFRLKKERLLRNLNRERELASIAWILCVYVHVYVWYVSVVCIWYVCMVLCGGVCGVVWCVSGV